MSETVGVNGWAYVEDHQRSEDGSVKITFIIDSTQTDEENVFIAGVLVRKALKLVRDKEKATREMLLSRPENL